MRALKAAGGELLAACQDAATKKKSDLVV
jgi:hypothetical protein